MDRQPSGDGVVDDLPTYDGVVDGDKLDGWIDCLESYFDIYGYDNSRRLAIARLKLASHALVWWNAHLRTYGSRGLTWDTFKILLKEQFYPVGYDEKRWQNWLSKASGQRSAELYDGILASSLRAWHITEQC
jgi:hypothetical protein